MSKAGRLRGTAGALAAILLLLGAPAHAAASALTASTASAASATPTAPAAPAEPAAAIAPASQTDTATRDVLDTITITATRISQPTFDVPASVDTVAIDPDALGVNVSESLQDVPGLVARNRQNYAQDEQISIRGFGARSSFGIRGVRIYADGIPASQPDGQGEVSQFNLASADRVEVLRGPFSALYGNAAGGVIQIFTADGHGPLQLDAATAYGSFGTWRASLDAQGGSNAFNYNMAYSQFATDGERGHSAAERKSLQGKWGFALGGGRLTVLLNYFDAPHAQDPLGLTQAQFNADPYQTAPSAAQFNTRKSTDQRQLGSIYELPIGDASTLRLMAYAGHRDVLQYQAIPVAVQANPASPGGVIQLGTDYGGFEPRWTWRSSQGGMPLSLIAGLSFDSLSQARRGYQNFIGPTLGILGPLRRDEIDTVSNIDPYLQAQWDLGSRWSADAGIRRSDVRFSSSDHYLHPGNTNDSGAVSYGATSPVAGLSFHATKQLNLYAAYGDGFETPTLDELAYRPDGSAGLNFQLRAARTSSVETGAKLHFAQDDNIRVAVFDAVSRNELVVVANTGGRSIYANAPLTRRDGAEWSSDLQLVPHLRLQLAYTWLDARVRQAYTTCSGIPCVASAAVVAAGSRLPGVPPQDLYASLDWRPRTDWHFALDENYAAAVFANDTNSARAPAFSLTGAVADHSWHLADGNLNGFARLDNLLNRRYIGSVIVNATNSQYFEAGPGRAVLVGLSFKYH